MGKPSKAKSVASKAASKANSGPSKSSSSTKKKKPKAGKAGKKLDRGGEAADRKVALVGDALGDDAGGAGKVNKASKASNGGDSLKSANTAPQTRDDADHGLAPSPDYSAAFAGSGRLADKVAIVTGGDRGIGRAVSQLYAREGARVAIVYSRLKKDAEETAKLVEAEGGQALCVKAALGSENSGKSIVRRVKKAFGRLDIIVNTAGEQHLAVDIRDMSAEQLQRDFAANIFGMFYLVQAALPHLKAGAAIINCTSVSLYEGAGHKGAGHKGAGALRDYSAAQGAITAFTRSLSENLAEQGIRVNAVAPADKIEGGGDSPSQQRPSEPDILAPSFLFLASDDSRYMSGQVLHPNGALF